MSFFGSSAIHTFAYGVANLTDNQVVVEVHGRCAYTDGRTVVLPAEGLWDDDGFRSLCGVACHEISHVWFGSNSQLMHLYEQLPQVNEARVQRAFNSIVDVADETRFERAMPRARSLFEATRDHVFKEAIASSIFPPATTQLLPEDQLLALGILWSRSPARSGVGKQLRRRFRNVRGLAEVIAILTKAREAKGARTCFRPNRTARQWKKLIDLTIQLIELLDHYYPVQPGQGSLEDDITSQQLSTSSLEKANSCNDACGENNFKPGASEQGNTHQNAMGGVVDPMTPWMEAAISSATERALIAVNDGLVPDSLDWEDLFSRDEFFDDWCCGNTSITSISNNYSVTEFRQECYDQVWPAFKRIAQTLVTGPTLTREDGFLTGGRLSRPHRAAIDGRCFQRANWEEEPDAAIAVIFDQSESMECFLDVFLPVGAALIDAFRAVPSIEIKILRFGSYVESVRNTSELRMVHTMGSTATHEAIQAAANWLDSKSTNRRAIVLFTDGEPDEVAATRESVVKLQRSGTVLLVGAIGLTEAQCAHSMPGAYVFSVDPENAGSSLHVAANRLRRQLP